METFKKRSGTTSRGFDFEDVHIANYVLQLVSNPEIEDFRLSSNDESYGAFDDIVVEIQYQHGKEIHALQLKHTNRENLLPIGKLQRNKGDFAIVKYFESFQKCNDLSQKFVLFTNFKFQVNGNEPLHLDGENFHVTLSKFYPNDVFAISETTSYCYKFSIVEDTTTSQDSARIQQYKTFFNNFFLYVDQKNVKDIRISTEKKFREMFLSNKVEFESYLKMISEWTQQEGQKEKLNKKWMQRAIAIHLLSSRTKPLCFVGVNEKGKILRQAISDFDITVFEKNAYGKVSDLWSDVKEEIQDLQEINKMSRKYQLSSTCIDNLDDVDPKLLSQLLWILGKCPLIVTEDQTGDQTENQTEDQTKDQAVYRAIKLCSNNKFIVLGKGFVEKGQEEFSVFRDLSDLKTESNVYKDLMNNFTCSLQGKVAVSLQVLFKQNQEVLHFVRTTDLLEMLDGPCNIGSEQEILPEPYIDRVLLRNVIDIRYIAKINEGTLIILNCADKFEDLKRTLRHHKFLDIDAYLSEDIMEFDGFGSTIYISKNECNLNKFQAASNKNKETKICHQFRYRDDGNLDWIRSKSDVSDLGNYKLFNEFVEEKVLWSSQPDNNINVIIGDPGMGKTELMKSFKNNCFSGFWTVVLYPKDVYSFFEQLKNRNNIVEAFEKFILNLKSKNFKALEQEIFKTCLKQNTVVYVWDALDEISTDHLEKVTHIILQLSERSSFQWVTSRQHLKKYLETKFNVLSITINQFNEEKQKSYIEKRLAASSKEESEQIINKIQSAFTLVKHKDVLGIPLQIYMLTELFRQNRTKYLDLLNNVFVLTDLYHYFIDEKTNIYYKKKLGVVPQNFQCQNFVEGLKISTLKNYEEFALKALFPEEILRRLNINCETELQSIQTNKSAIGIITEVTNEIPHFPHASFAEYLVALYFSKHLELKDIVEEIIFQQKYVNIRFFFDLLLAKASPSHIAILYKDSDFLKNCAEEILKRKDAGGRSILHLACSWGQRYPPLNVENSENCYLIDDFDSAVTAEAPKYLDIIGYLTDQCDVLENDTLFNMTPLSYAQKGDCLFAELIIIQKQKKQLSNSDSVDINILYYSAKFGYSDALDLFIAENLSFIKARRNGYSLLHLAVGHNDFIVKLLKTEIYKNKIHDKDREGNTPLHLAAYSNYYETVNILIEYGAGTQIDVLNNSCISSLFFACQNGHDRIVEVLIKFGAKVNYAMQYGYTPLSIASEKGHDQIVEILIKSKADIDHANHKGSTPLSIASRQGHDKIVKILIKPGANFNFADKGGSTPLYIACEQGHDKIVDILIESGVDINLANNDGSTPLSIASRKGHENIVEILITSKVHINLADKFGRTPLSIASEEGHDKIVEILLNSGADTNLADTGCSTPLLNACRRGHDKIVEMLIKFKANMNHAGHDGSTPLLIAYQLGHDKIVELLMKSRADINLANNGGSTLLFIASRKGDDRFVELLIRSGADVSRANKRYGCTPLTIATEYGHDTVVEILIISKADINLADNFGQTPLYIASRKGHEKIVEILIKYEADINLADNHGSTPLSVASFNGYDKIVELLINSGADINCVMKDGRTPLYNACREGHDKIVEILIKFKADINLADNNGSTPLLVAFKNEYDKIIELLLESAADVNLADNEGCTPLSIACASRKGQAKFVEILIRAVINRSENDGSTPLYIASRNGHDKIVEILIKYKADINLANNDGSTPLLIAAQMGHDKIVEILINAGADVNVANKGGLTLLCIASHMGHEKMCERLITFGVDINCVTKNGSTPLLIAAQMGHYKIVEILINSEADINLADNDGCTPLYIASREGHDKIVEILINAGADINRAKNDGSTPLSIASQHRYQKIVVMLKKSRHE